MSIWKFLGILISLTAMQASYAHGEDEPGPHNGIIRMPGSYHVEVIPGKDALDVMLLDINFKNPTVLNSHIKVRIKTAHNAYVIRCESMDNYFSCPVNANMLSRNGTLEIRSKRQLAEGMTVEYPLPLELPKPKQSV